MHPAPRLDALDVFRAAEVIAVGGLAQPTLLTSPFASGAAGGLGTKNLMVAVAVIGRKELAAAEALAWFDLGRHKCSPKEEKSPLKATRQTCTARTQGKKEEDAFSKLGKKTKREEDGISNRQEYTNFSSPLTNGPQQRFYRIVAAGNGP